MRRRLQHPLLACAALLAVLPSAAPAQPGTELTVYLTTIGPGARVWERFGHNAIWIHDATTGTTISYNYGMFDYFQPGFVPRLMAGHMLYSMDARDAQAEADSYAADGRSVTAQRLNLTPAQRHELREFLEWNWLPPNRDYLYDYFHDNCSTRVRDALDRALGGALRAALVAQPTGTTFRSHSLRLTADLPLTYTGLLIGLGLPTDRPIDAWQETFIPMALMEHARAIRVLDDTGAMVPLVAEERVVVPAQRPDAPAAPPFRLPAFMLLGGLLAGALVLLARAARPRADAGRAAGAAPPGGAARFALAVALSLWGVTTGVLGLILTLLWLFTDHTAAYPNMNLLQLNPLGLLLAVAGPLALATRPGGAGPGGGGPGRFALARAAWPTALALLALSAAGLLLLLVPSLRQASAPVLALALPVHAAALYSLYHVVGGLMSSPEDRSGRTALSGTA